MQMAWSRHICLFAKKINLLDLPHAAQSSFKFHVVSVEKVKMAMKQSVYACTRVRVSPSRAAMGLIIDFLERGWVILR